MRSVVSLAGRRQAEKQVLFMAEIKRKGGLRVGSFFFSVKLLKSLGNTTLHVQQFHEKLDFDLFFIFDCIYGEVPRPGIEPTPQQ